MVEGFYYADGYYCSHPMQYYVIIDGRLICTECGPPRTPGWLPPKLSNKPYTTMVSTLLRANQAARRNRFTKMLMHYGRLPWPTASDATNPSPGSKDS